MRYISASQRSQSVRAPALGVAVSADVTTVMGRGGLCASGASVRGAETSGFLDAKAGASGLDTEQIMSWLANQSS
jgi:hypothetical protein